MSVLCVAEKPSIAKEIAKILSGDYQVRGVRECFSRSNARQPLTMAQNPITGNPYIRNYEFDYPQTRSHFIVTAVTGHLTTQDFTDRHRKWSSCDPSELWDAPTVVSVPEKNKPIERNILSLARRAHTVMIWTDCDREGEHIGLEVVEVCRKVKANITVRRARFSAIIAQYALCYFCSQDMYSQRPDKSIMLLSTLWT